MRKSFSFKKSIFTSWVLSYISILTISLIITSIVYILSISVIEEEVSKANAATLKQLQQFMDQELRNIESLIVEVGFDNQIHGIAYLKDDIDIYHKYTIASIIKDFKLNILANDFLETMYIYLRKSDTIISEDGMYNSEDFYQFNYEHNSNVSYEEWMEGLNENYKKEYKTIISKKDDGTLNDSIAFFQSLPIGQSQDTEATLVLILNGEKLDNAIHNMKWLTQGNIFVIDDGNHILMSTDSASRLKGLNYDELQYKQKIFHKKINNREVAVSQLDSEITNWKYLSIIPIEVFWAKARFIRKVTYLCVAVCLLIGFLCAYYFSKQNYNPIDKLVNLFIDEGRPFEKNRSNEYNFIQTSIIQTIEYNKKTQQALQQQKETMRIQFLVRLLKGNISSHISIDDAIESYDIALKDGYYTIELLYIEDIADGYSIVGCKSNGDIIDTVKLVLQGMVNEFIQQYNDLNMIYVVEIEGMLACLLNFSKSANDKVKLVIAQIAEDIKSCLKKQYQVSVTIAVSDVHDGLQKINSAYYETIHIMEYRVLLGKSRIISFDEVQKLEQKDYKYQGFFVQEQKFMNFIKQNDYKSAGIVIDEVFSNYLTAHSIHSLEILKCRMFGLINVMFDAMAEISIVCEDKFLQGLNIVNKLTGSETVQELKNHLCDILSRIDDYIGDKKLEKNINIEGYVMDFVKENYADIDLNVSMIADRLQMNVQYLSKHFKKNTGIGLLDYIHKIRIKKAKVLMMQKNSTVKDVAEKVGYNNSIAFIRVFKKYEGVTPGKYLQ